MVDRQTVIDEAINIENVISSLITAHYFPAIGLNLKFLQEVLYDPLCSFGMKINVLEKCYPDISQKIIQKLRRLANIRNLFAHCGLHFTNIVDPDKSGFLDPKYKDKRLDFVKLKEEFLEIKNDILDDLIKKIEEVGIEMKSS